MNDKEKLATIIKKLSPWPSNLSANTPATQRKQPHTAQQTQEIRYIKWSINYFPNRNTRAEKTNKQKDDYSRPVYLNHNIFRWFYLLNHYQIRHGIGFVYLEILSRLNNFDYTKVLS